MSAIPLALEGEVASLLRRFTCTAGLCVDDLVVLASRCSVEHLPTGQQLFAAGDRDPWLMLLLDGALELSTADGRAQRLESGTPAAGHPVANHRPRRFAAHTATPVTLLRIDGSDLGHWQVPPESDNAGVGSTSLDGLGVLVGEFDDYTLDFGEPDPLTAHRLRIASGELALPSLPAVALDACRAIDRDDASAAELARVLLNDPAITVKLLRVANSPLFYGQVAVDSCERAVLRLGLRTTRRLVIAFSVREVFRSDQPVLQRLAEELWQHSTSVAALSFVLARELGGFDAEEAQLAGLLHDIGVLPVLGYAAGEPGLRNDPRGVATLAASLRVSLGRRLLDEWGLESGLVAAAVHAEDWWRAGAGPADLGDLVIVAQSISLLASGDEERMPPLAELPAFRRLCAARMSADEVLDLVAEADEQVCEVRSLLQA